MSTELVVVLVVAALLLGAAAAWVLMQRRRSDQLRRSYGPEYDRTVRETGRRSAAERELEARRERVQQLHIHPLQPGESDRFATEWLGVQKRFVDAPEQAVGEADRLVTEVMQRRGYPMGDFEQRAADLSVDHGPVVEHYREAHRVAERNRDGGATTEELRRAMVHYRTLFDDLLEERSMREGGAR